LLPPASQIMRGITAVTIDDVIGDAAKRVECAQRAALIDGQELWIVSLTSVGKIWSNLTARSQGARCQS
jgi:hypothetical protein